MIGSYFLFIHSDKYTFESNCFHVRHCLGMRSVYMICGIKIGVIRFFELLSQRPEGLYVTGMFPEVTYVTQFDDP